MMKQFKSGTDVRGTALGDETKHDFLSDEIIKKITVAFVDEMQLSGKKISVGHDCRLSAERIKAAVICALLSRGVSVIDCGLSSTPAMFMTTKRLGCDAAVQITASHHPSDKNGLKFFLDTGGINGSQLEAILNRAESEVLTDTVEGKVSSIDFMPEYAEILRSVICEKLGDKKPLEGFHIIVDAGNGVGGFYATDVLEPLGADISGSVYLEPDGFFPNHIPNPENEEAMKSISEAVIDSGAQLGLIFDTDVDRAACVDGSGREISRNSLVALAAAIALDSNEGGTIVTDSIVSDALISFVSGELGGKIMPFKRGYKNVIDKQIELNLQGVNCPLAIETSGHAAFRDNYYLDDGAYLAAKIIVCFALLAKKGESISSLLSKLPMPLEEKEIRIRIAAEDFKKYAVSVLEGFEPYAQTVEGWSVVPDTYEGVRVRTPDGWFQIRLSVHDPVIPMNYESSRFGGIHAAAAEVLEYMKFFSLLDLSDLEKYVESVE